MTCGGSVVFSRYSSFLHQQNWPSWYNWYIVESGVTHHKTNKTKPWIQILVTTNNTHSLKLLVYAQGSEEQNESWLTSSQRLLNYFGFSIFSLGERTWGWLFQEIVEVINLKIYFVITIAGSIPLLLDPMISSIQ